MAVIIVYLALLNHHSFSPLSLNPRPYYFYQCMHQYTHLYARGSLPRLPRWWGLWGVYGATTAHFLREESRSPSMGGYSRTPLSRSFPNKLKKVDAFPRRMMLINYFGTVWTIRKDREDPQLWADRIKITSVSYGSSSMSFHSYSPRCFGYDSDGTTRFQRGRGREPGLQIIFVVRLVRTIVISRESLASSSGYSSSDLYVR